MGIMQCPLVTEFLKVEENKQGFQALLCHMDYDRRGKTNKETE